MAVCTNSVFHFTRPNEKTGMSGVKILQNIITEGFMPKCCKEMLLNNGEKSFMFIPQVSFCDIPLSQIKEHSTSYGNYAIALTKEWARLKELNPVIYITPNSCIQRELSKMYKKLCEMVCNNPCTAPDGLVLLENIYMNLSFFKYECGPLVRKEKVIDEKYIFYKEREWRFVVEPSSPTITDPGKAESKNKQLMAPKYRLKFELDDISYIIVEKEKEKLDMINFFKNDYIKNNGTSQVQIDTVLTKLMSFEDLQTHV